MIYYKFIGASEFFKRFYNDRIALFTGDLGSGKTIFQVIFGYEMLRLGMVTRAAYNFPVAFGSAPTPRNCFIGLDEIGVVFENRFTFKNKEQSDILTNITYTLRKEGSYLTSASFIDVDKKLRTGLRVWRVAYLSKYLWLYHWQKGEEDINAQRPGTNFFEGRFAIFNPATFFGTYDTYFVPPKAMTLAFIRGFLGEWMLPPSDIVLPKPEVFI